MKHMIRSTLAALCLASVSLAVPALAHAAAGYVTGNVNLRAGPDPGYPPIDVIPAGTEVNVQGCTEGWEWCDVIVHGNRGWVAGNYVEYVYQDRPVLLPAYGARIGIPIISFTIGNYWDTHYRSRPFYRERTRWYRRPIVHRPPPPPMRHPYRPSMHGTPGHGRPPINRPHPPITHRPTPSRPARPTHPTRPPTPSHRPAARPGQQTRPPANRPAPGAGHAQPVRSDHGKSRPADKKSDHRGH